MYLLNIQYHIIIIDCLASFDIGFLGVTISNVTLSCSQYLYKYISSDLCQGVDLEKIFKEIH